MDLLTLVINFNLFYNPSFLIAIFGFYNSSLFYIISWFPRIRNQKLRNRESRMSNSDCIYFREVKLLISEYRTSLFVGYLLRNFINNFLCFPNLQFTILRISEIGNILNFSTKCLFPDLGLSISQIRSVNVFKFCILCCLFDLIY